MMNPCSTCKHYETRGSSINMCEVCYEADEYEPITDKTKEEYTEQQLERVLHNLQIILDITSPHLKNKDLELIYTCANDSMCRIEGITHYPPTEEEEE